MHDLLDTAPCGFLSFSDDGTITTVNATLLAMLGYAHDELTGQSVERIFTVGTRIFYQTHFFPLIRLHGRAEEIFLMLRAADGAEVGVLANAVRNVRSDEPVNDCVFIRVAERQKFERELVLARRAAESALSELRTRSEEMERLKAVADEASRAKSSFLAMMSHELRTPLNAIGGYAQLMEMGVQGPINEKQREALSRIDQSSRHLLRLVNEVLNLARVESGRVEYDLTDVDVESAIGELLPLVEPQLQQKALHLSVAVPPGTTISADREKMTQIILNLLSNAIKFTPRDGAIFITAKAQEGGDIVEISVRDTGVGIPPHMLNTIFDPFVQVEVHRSKRVEGTGLGLTISRDMARGMNGDLAAFSEEGVGSTFVLTLKAATGRPLSAEEASQEG